MKPKRDGAGRKKKRMTGKKVSSASSNPGVKKFRAKATEQLASRAAVAAKAATRQAQLAASAASGRAGKAARKTSRREARSSRGGRGSGSGGLTADKLRDLEDDLAEAAEVGAAAAAAAPVSSAAFGEAAVSDDDDEAVDDPFAPVRQKWNSQLETDKEICAVLAVVTESIEEKGGPLTPTAYWGTLMTTLEGADSDEDDKAIAAVVYLLSLVSARVPTAIIQRQFADAAAVFISVLTAHAETGSQAMLKATLTCLGSLVAANDSASWGPASAARAYKPLLAFSVDTRPKVRKAAQAAVKMVAARAVEDDAEHPALTTTATFCRKELREETSVPHVLNLLVGVLPTFPPSAMQQVIAALFGLMEQGQALILESCSSVLIELFQSATDQLPTELLVQTIDELFDRQPSVSNALQRAEWNSVVGTGLGLLAKRDPVACCEKIPQYIADVLPGYGSDRNELTSNVTQCLHGVVDTCIPPVADAILADGGDFSALNDTAAALQDALKLRFQAYLPEILGIIETFFEILGPNSDTVLADILQSLVQLRATESVRCIANVERTVGAAATAMGIEAFVGVVEMDLASDEPKEEFATAWLLPVLKSTLTGGQLEYFASNVMPLANILLGHYNTLEGEGDGELAALYRTLYVQVWDLLPTFCAQATDVAENYRRIVRTLRSILEAHSELRGPVCTALSTLIRSDLRTDEDLAAIGGFGKNLLPTLFTLYCDPSAIDSTRARCLSAIEAYVDVTPASVLTNLMQNVFNKLAEPGDAQSHQDLMDLCIVMAGSVGDAGQLFGMLSPLITSDNSALQKKAYKALLMLCASEKEEHRAFVSDKIGDVVTLVQESVSAATPAAKHYRMNLIAAIVRALPPDGIMEFLPEVMTEIIMCTKEVNERARASAFACLIDIGATVGMIGEDDTDSEVNFGNFFNMVVAGLGSERPHMQSATVLALSRLVYEYRNEVPPEDFHALFEGIIALLEARSREVVKSAIGFVKVAVVILDADELAPHLGPLLAGLVHWSGPAFRQKVKMIFERLIRKFDYETIAENTPEEHHKLINNIRKSKERERRKKGERRVAHDEEFEDDEAFLAEPRLAHKPSYDELLYGSEEEDGDGARDGGPRGGAGRLREYLDGEGFDLLDPDSGGQRSRRPAADAEPFKVGEDGRWIIPEDSENSGDDDSDGAAAAAPADDDDDGLTYGRGIHRDRPGFAASFGKRKMKKEHRVDDAGSDDDAAALAADEALAKRKAKAIGKLYRAKKAGGDMKLKDGPDPYAYVPFDARRLNRRKRAKATGEFKGMMRAAKKGASKGSSRKVGKAAVGKGSRMKISRR